MQVTEESHPGVVILGGESQGLSILRSLATEGIETVVVDQDRFCVAKASKHLTRFFRSPAYSDNTAFVNFLLDIGNREHLSGWFLFPTDDDQVKAITQNRDRLARVYSGYPMNWAQYKYIYRKDLLLDRAASLGFRIPKTLNAADLDNTSQLSFPVVVKPAYKGDFVRKTHRKAIAAGDWSKLSRLIEEFAQFLPKAHVLIQEIIGGGTRNQISYAGLFSNGHPLVEITAAKHREHPPSFGTATYIESRQHPKAHATGRKLLNSLGCTGPCEVEFQDPGDGDDPVLIEVNPRFWGWHAIFGAYDVNLPYLYYLLLQGELKAEYTRICLDRISAWQHILTDIPMCFRHALRSLRFHTTTLTTSSKIHPVFCLSDPLPFLWEVAISPYLLWRRGY